MLGNVMKCADTLLFVRYWVLVFWSGTVLLRRCDIEFKVSFQGMPSPNRACYWVSKVSCCIYRGARCPDSIFCFISSKSTRKSPRLTFRYRQQLNTNLGGIRKIAVSARLRYSKAFSFSPIKKPAIDMHCMKLASSG